MQTVSDAHALADPQPVVVLNQHAQCPVVFCCDHAGAEMPARLGGLGVPEADRNDHIGIDLGIFATTSWVAGELGATLVAQQISRLVIDCNRKADSPESIRTHYDGRAIPGNKNLAAAERHSRNTDILMPYQAAVGAALAATTQRLGRPAVLMAMHSFTRQMGAERREVDIGVIFEGKQVFAETLLEALTEGTDLNVLRNEPYRIDFKGDYTIPHHTDAGKLPYVEIEICQDLISSCQGQRRLSRILLAGIKQAMQAL